MLKLTEETKRKYAEMLRNPKMLSSTLPEEYFHILDEMETKTFTILARDGYEIPVWLVRPKNSEPDDMVYMNVHGGGYVQRHSRYDSAFCATAAKRMNCWVLDVDYRLAPEYPFPYGFHDVYDTYKWLLNHLDELKVSPDKVVIGGNSAGGQFSAAVCMMAQEEHIPAPAVCAMLYPSCNVSSVENLSEDLDLSKVENRALFYYLLYCSKESDFESPYVNLMKAKPEMLTKFPDLVLATGGLDPLAPDAETFACRVAASSGSRVVMKRFLHSKHGFLNRCIGDEWEQGREYVFREILSLAKR